jgi:Predicted oxidoreductases (related to aryl-alcohol dehydrogenases)
LIGGIGLSEVSVDTYQTAHNVHPIAAIQTEYSLLSKEPENGMLQACKENGTAFVGYSPMSRGLLTGQLNASTVSQNGDARQFLPRFSGENLDANLTLVEALTELAKDKSCSLAQLALAWVLAQEEFIHIIPGTRREKYLLDNFNSLNVELTAAELLWLRAHFDEGKVAGSRYPEAAMAGIEN